MSQHDWQTWSRHASSVRAYLRSAEWREEERADVLAETALAASAVTPRRQDDPGVRSFFVGFAANLLRRRRREELKRSELSGHLELVPPPPADPQAALEQREELAKVWEAIAALPETQQQLLRLLALEGLSPSEAARRLGIPEATARTRLFQARRNLEARLERRPPARRARGALLLLALALLLMGGAALARVLLPLVRRLVVEASASTKSTQHLAPRPEAHPRASDPPSLAPPAPMETMAREEAPPAHEAQHTTPRARAVEPRPLTAPPLVDAPSSDAVPTEKRASPEAPAADAPRGATGSPLAMGNEGRSALATASPPASDTALYSTALAAHLRHDAPTAVAAWTAFLSAAPRGPLEAEARFRRAQARTWLGDWALARGELEALLPAVVGTGLEDDIERLLARAPRQGAEQVTQP